MEKKQLPKLADLHHDVQTAFKNDELNLLLNQPPSAAWVKKHPMTGQPYLPIDKVEFLLTYIFQEWYVEVKQVQALFQSIAVTVSLYYKNPLTGAWCKTEGVGASPVQTDAGKNASDLGAIKNAAVQMAVPAAKSYAIKDAAEHLGILFGRDLNRKDTVQFAGAYGNDTPPNVSTDPGMTYQRTQAPVQPAAATIQQHPSDTNAVNHKQPNSFNFNTSAL